jgi:hypothetical protein
MRRGLVVLLAWRRSPFPRRASAKVKLVSVTSPASLRGDATLTVSVTKPTTCKIIVIPSFQRKLNRLAALAITVDIYERTDLASQADDIQHDRQATSDLRRRGTATRDVA